MDKHMKAILDLTAETLKDMGRTILRAQYKLIGIWLDGEYSRLLCKGESQERAVQLVMLANPTTIKKDIHDHAEQEVTHSMVLSAKHHWVSPDARKKSKAPLEEQLQQEIEAENYERAAEIKALIQERDGSK